MQLPRGHIVVAIEPPDNGSGSSSSVAPPAGDGSQAAPPPSERATTVREDDIKFRIGEDPSVSSAAAQASSSSSTAPTTGGTVSTEVDADEAPPPYALHEEDSTGTEAATDTREAAAPVVPTAAAAASPQLATAEFRPPSGQPSVEWDGPRCFVVPEQLASLQSKRPTVPLSGLAASVLVSRKMLSANDLILYVSPLFLSDSLVLLHGFEAPFPFSSSLASIRTSSQISIKPPYPTAVRPSLCNPI